MDEQLITPLVDCSQMEGVTLAFDNAYTAWGDVADVDVRSSRTGGDWTNVARWTVSDTGPRSFDLAAHAAGASDLQVRWHFYNANYGYYWGIDNVVLTGTPQTQCNPKPQLPLEVSRPGQTPLQWGEFEGSLQLFWESKGTCGADTFNVYRATREQLEAGNYGTCRQSGLASHPFDETLTPDPTVCWFYTVSGENAIGEGPLGYASGASSPTAPASFCP